MANVKFELNRAGVKELLNSSEMQTILAEYAKNVLDRCPKGYGMSVGKTSQRAKASVGTRGYAGASDNAKNKTLLKALGG